MCLVSPHTPVHLFSLLLCSSPSSSSFASSFASSLSLSLYIYPGRGIPSGKKFDSGTLRAFYMHIIITTHSQSAYCMVPSGPPVPPAVLLASLPIRSTNVCLQIYSSCAYCMRPTGPPAPPAVLLASLPPTTGTCLGFRAGGRHVFADPVDDDLHGRRRPPAHSTRGLLAGAARGSQARARPSNRRNQGARTRARRSQGPGFMHWWGCPRPRPAPSRTAITAKAGGRARR